MKVIFLLLYFLFALQSYYSIAQVGDPNFGARSKSLGNTNSNLADEWAMFNNVGGISGLEKGTICFGYDKLLGIEGFDRIAVGIVQPFKFGTTGISVYRFGDDLYNEGLVSAAFGNKIGFVRLGIRANYFQMRINEFGTTNALFLDFGGIVELIPSLSFGAYISNFTLSKMQNSEKTNLPVIMKIGFSYTPVSVVSLNVDLYKDVDYQPIIKAGIEYAIHEKFFIRTGINSDPFTAFFGLGVYLDRFHIDYAVGANPYLGTTHQASVSFMYQKKDEK